MIKINDSETLSVSNKGVSVLNQGKKEKKGGSLFNYFAQYTAGL